ncbi:MAG: hypothetical protein Q9201_005376 [Fulgogasparrea decipioides]
MMCFGSRKRISSDYPPYRRNEPPVQEGSDDLSDVFQSLSLKNGPVASVQSAATSLNLPSPPLSARNGNASRNDPKAATTVHNTAAPEDLPSPLSSAQYTTASSNVTKPAPSVHGSTASWNVPSPPPSGQHTAPSGNNAKNPLRRIPIFPIQLKPQCPQCREDKDVVKDTVKPWNSNGNVDRPFYICKQCKNSTTPPRTTSTGRARRKGWVTWDDEVGIDVDNPPCDCRGGFVSRQDRGGTNSYYPGGGFWTCATGQCDYLSYHIDGRPKKPGRWDEGFEPWLLPPLENTQKVPTTCFCPNDWDDD